MSISKFFVNGSEEKLSKQVLADDVTSSLLPPATAEDEGKVVSVTETGEYELSTVESGLPVATSEDAGKVVAVDETGAYELAEAGGGSAPFVVTFSGSTADGDAACDKTYAEIKAAYDSGRIVLFQHPANGLPGVIPTEGENDGTKYFVSNVVGSNVATGDLTELYATTCAIQEDNSVFAYWGGTSVGGD